MDRVSDGVGMQTVSFELESVFHSQEHDNGLKN